jgi:AcrR family transcriptional regulator
VGEVNSPAPTVAPNPAGHPVALPLAGAPCERSDAAANRARILAAARDVLDAEGASGLSMNAVALAAGVGKGTIFRRFGDRDGLTAALLDAHTTELQDAFLSGPPPLGPGAPPCARLEAFMRALVSFQVSHLEIVLAAVRVEAQSPPVYGTFLIHIRSLLEQIDPGCDAPVLAGLLLSAVSPESLARLIRDDGAEADVERVADGAVAVLRGLSRLVD